MVRMSLPLEPASRDIRSAAVAAAIVVIWLALVAGAVVGLLSVRVSLDAVGLAFASVLSLIIAGSLAPAMTAVGAALAAAYLTRFSSSRDRRWPQQRDAAGTGSRCKASAASSASMASPSSVAWRRREYASSSMSASSSSMMFDSRSL